MPFLNFFRSSSLLLLCLAAQTSTASTLKYYPESFSKLAKVNHGKLGIYATDTAGTFQIQHNASQRFPLCSTAKLLIVAAILKKSETTPNFLTQTIYYSPETLKASGYAPITKQHLNDGMTIKQLCAAAMEYSDNAAANLLVAQLGGIQAVNAYARSIGDKQFQLNRLEPLLNSATPDDNRDTTTPQAMAQTLQNLVFGNLLPIYQHQLLVQWLKDNTTGNNRISSAFPINWIVGDKTGTGSYGTTNDIAVVWPPKGKPLIIAIYFTQDSKNAEPNEAIIREATELVLNKAKAQINNRQPHFELIPDPNSTSESSSINSL